MGEENSAPERPSFYAVIPADVRYNKALPPRAILLYGEISALCNSRGYCDARNAYFAKNFQVSKNTISDLIGQLEAAGYIHTEILRNEKNVVEQRRIWLNAQFATGASVSANDGSTPIPKNRDTSPEKSGYPIPKNREENITSINNITPIAPKKKNAESEEVLTLLKTYAGGDTELLDALMAFDEKRCTVMHSPIGTARSVKILTNKLNAYSRGDRRAKIALLEEATEKNWKSVFQHDEKPAARKAPDNGEGVPDW